MSSSLPVSGGPEGSVKDAAATIHFYEALVGRLAELIGWMDEQLHDDTQGSLRLLATKYAVHRGLERWADPPPDPQIDSAREAAIMLLAFGRPPRAPAVPVGRSNAG
jgi:hypothetical protein